MSPPDTNWRKIIWRSFVAIPAAFLAGGVVRGCFFITNSIYDLYQPVYEAWLTLADYGVMVVVLVSCLPRFKRTASVLSGVGIVFISGYLMFFPLIYHNKGSFKLEDCIIHIPSIVFGFYCVICYFRAEVIRNNQGIDEFKNSSPFDLFRGK